MENPKNLYEYSKIFNDNIRISFKGPFDHNIISILGEYINNIMEKDQEGGRKLYKIFFELAQNISYYSAERTDLSNEENVGMGVLLILENENEYAFQIGNQVKSEDVEVLLKKCEYINSLNYDDLRKYKREQRKTAPGERGGAHIGLIQVAITSLSPLDMEVTKLENGNSFIEFHIRIKKESK